MPLSDHAAAPNNRFECVAQTRGTIALSVPHRSPHGSRSAFARRPLTLFGRRVVGPFGPHREIEPKSCVAEEYAAGCSGIAILGQFASSPFAIRLTSRAPRLGGNRSPRECSPSADPPKPRSDARAAQEAQHGSKSLGRAKSSAKSRAECQASNKRPPSSVPTAPRK